MKSCNFESIPQAVGSAWRIAIIALCVHSVLCSSVSANIVVLGDVTPDPHTTNSNSTLYVGNTSDGSVAITDGNAVTSFLTYIGYASTATGIVDVSGVANPRLNSSALYAGVDGNGTLNLSSGGAATAFSVIVAENVGSVGNISVIDISSSLKASAAVDVGWGGVGSMTIANGGTVTSFGGQLGLDSSAKGSVTIDGAGSSWTSTASLIIGSGGQGTATVQNGGTLSTPFATLGSISTGVGKLTVTGPQSVWNNSSDMTIGGAGSGTLMILQGATVTAGGDTTVSRNSGSTGHVDFDNGTLKTGGLLTSVSDLQGTGTIFTHGLVTDIDLAFDGSHPLQQQLVFNDGASQNVTVNLDASAAGSMGAGFQGQATLLIADGVVVHSKSGVLGYRSGSVGVARVLGAGSEWVTTADLSVGQGGVGYLIINNGGVVQVAGTTTVGTAAGSAISLSDGTLTTTSLFARTYQLQGVGTINTHGLVTNIALVFDHTHPLQRQLGVIKLDADGSGIMGAGYFSEGSLSIKDAVTLPSTAGFLGYGSNSAGTATVSGPGSTWSITGGLSVGAGGIGNLTISNGGAVVDNSATVANGKVVVTDQGSTWTSPQGLSVGGAGAPEVLISNGGRLISAAGPLSVFSPTIGAQLLNGIGKVTVDGPGSNWTHTGSLTVGPGSQLIVSSAATLTSAAATLGSNLSFGGSNQPASATITGAGSFWTSSGAVTVGSGYAASLNITHGGAMTSTAGAIGAQSGGAGPGLVNVSDPGSTWTITGPLVVGGSISFLGGGTFPAITIPGGPGALTIGPGGAVHDGDTTIFSQGQINLQGGDLYTTSITIRFNNSPSSSFAWTSGSLHVDTFNGDLVNSAGVLSPGQSPGKTTITGTYTQQTAATLQIELAGNSSGTQYDFVNVTGTGNSTLGGTLQLSLLNGYLPSPTDTFTILSSAGNLLGSFTNVANGDRLTTSDGFGSFRVSYGAGSSFNAKQVVLSNFIAVPEPSVLVLVGLLLGPVACARAWRFRF